MTEQHDHAPQIARRKSQIYGIYQNMLSNTSKSVPSGKAQLMQNVFDQIHEGVVAAEPEAHIKPRIASTSTWTRG